MISSRARSGLVRLSLLPALLGVLLLSLPQGLIAADGSGPDEDGPTIQETPFEGSFPLFTPEASTPVVEI